MLRLCFLCLVAILGAPLSYAVKEVSLTPLKPSAVADCGKGGETVLPVITWGGDMATIYANGGGESTQPGSIFDKKGLKFKLVRADNFRDQLQGYMSCKSPFLRGTMGMMTMAAEAAAKDPRTALNIIYQMTWSAGGDALVVKAGIQRPADLKGKTIALQAHGPHVDYLGKILSDAGVSLKQVKIKWLPDLTGTQNTPKAALYEQGVDAAMVIIPDALALTSNGTVGTGAEDSVKGAKILLSTKSANRIIADVYAVRSDYLKANKESVGNLVHALMMAQEQLQDVVKKKSSAPDAYSKVMKSSAKLLLDSEQAVADAEGLYADARFVGWAGNRRFFADKNYPRGFTKLSDEIGGNLLGMGVIAKKAAIMGAPWDYAQLKKGMIKTDQSDAGRFDAAKVAQVVRKRETQGTLADGSLFAFEVFFQPNQNDFPAQQYQADFKKVINLASTYGGAIITIEGHSDPLGYLKKKKAGASNIVLHKVRQSAKNLSMTRANGVRDALIQFAKASGVTLDPTQFAVIGHGIAKPRSGLCGMDPCPPKTKQQWLDNMRVEFKLIQVEAEEAVFSPI